MKAVWDASEASACIGRNGCGVGSVVKGDERKVAKVSGVDTTGCKAGQLIRGDFYTTVVTHQADTVAQTTE